jgi:hypothetical protein
MDVHVPQSITEQLRRRGIDVLTALNHFKKIEHVHHNDFDELKEGRSDRVLTC